MFCSHLPEIEAMPSTTASRPNASPGPAPFRSAEQAWLWTSRRLAARRHGKPHERRLVADEVGRSCTPDDVLRCLDSLYRSGRIDMVHARVLRKWGERGCAPDRRDGGDRSEYRQWRDALDRLDDILRRRGIVAGFGFLAAETRGPEKAAAMFPKNNRRSPTKQLTGYSTRGSVLFEANLDGSLIAGRVAGVSRPHTSKLLPLAAISPPNPDQLRVASIGATLPFLVRSPGNPTHGNKEI
jgi:hypothetical protein